VHFWNPQTNLHFEAQLVDGNTVLIRAEIGGFTPRLVTPDRILEEGIPVTERRVADRRVGPQTRRRRREVQSDRRCTGRWIGMNGRRRNDAIEWEQDLADARQRAYVARRTSGPQGRA